MPWAYTVRQKAVAQLVLAPGAVLVFAASAHPGIARTPSQVPRRPETALSDAGSHPRVGGGTQFHPPVSPWPHGIELTDFLDR